MASSMPTSDADHHQNQPHSFFTKTVTLFDWWLINTETNNQKGLGVSGSTSTQKQALRVFSSAPIAKRYDVFTVETVDGICVVLKTFINQNRTMQNGFSSQVARHFALGFPNDWERYCGQEDPTVDVQPVKKLDSPRTTRSTVKKLNTVPIVSTPVSNDPLSDRCESPVQSPEELQRPVVAKVAEKLGDNIDNASKPKRGHKPKAALDTDRKEERMTLKKSKRKIVPENNAKEARTPASKIKRRIVFEEQATPQAQSDNAAKRIVSPDCLSPGRSRSGRILLPVLEFWRNQIPVYDVDRNVTGIQEERHVPSVLKTGSRSEPQKKRKR